MGEYKKYLNRQEKTEMLMFFGIVDLLQEIVASWQERDRPKEIIKYLKTARTFIEKVTILIFSHLEKGQSTGLLRLAKQAEKTPTVLGGINEAVDVEYDKQFEMEWEDFCDLAEIVLCCCLQCTLPKGDTENCNVKRIFLKYDLDVLDADNPTCPYQYQQHWLKGDVADK